jgi:Protein of unknown function (DUF2442)
MSNFRHIRRVTAFSNYRLVLDWDDGSRSIKDMADLIQRRAAFKALSDPETFAKVRVADHGRALRWTRGIDYDADALWAESKTAVLDEAGQVHQASAVKRLVKRRTKRRFKSPLRKAS